MKQTQLLLWSSGARCFSYSSVLPTGPVHGNDDGVLPLHIHDPGEYMDPRFMLMSGDTTGGSSAGVPSWNGFPFVLTF